MEEIVSQIVVETSGSSKSLKELKDDFKALDNQLGNAKKGTQEFNDTLIKLGQTKGAITKLREEIGALNPEGRAQAFAKIGGTIAGGFQAATAAAALFGSKGQDIQKVLLKVQAATALQQGIASIGQMGDAFKQLGLIIKANPIFLIASIIIAVGAALYALKDKIPFVGKAFQVLGDAIDEIIQTFKDLGDAIGITSFKSDEMHKKMIDNATKQSQAIADRYDREIKYAQAAGKETFELEKKKQLAILETLKIQASEIYLIALKEKRKLNEDEVKALDDIKQKAIDVYATINETNIKEVKSHSDKNAKILEDRKKHHKELADADEKSIQVLLSLQAYFYQQIENEEQQKLLNQLDRDDAQVAKEKKNREKNDEELKKQEEYRKNLKIQLAEQANTVIANLSDTLFSNALQKAHGNARAEYDIKKKQFQFNKALAATHAAISTVEAVQKNYSQGGLVIGSALNIAQIIIGAANVAAILGKKYPAFEGGGGDSSVPNTGSTGVPDIKPPQNQQQQVSTTQLQTNQQGNFTKFDKPLKAYIVETEVTATQQRVKQIEQRATF